SAIETRQVHFGPEVSPLVCHAGEETGETLRDYRYTDTHECFTDSAFGKACQACSLRAGGQAFAAHLFPLRYWAGPDGASRRSIRSPLSRHFEAASVARYDQSLWFQGRLEPSRPRRLFREAFVGQQKPRGFLFTRV